MLTLVYMILMSSESVWHVKLPAEWKEIFEKKAEQDGDKEHGAGPRAVRKFIREKLEEGEA